MRICSKANSNFDEVCQASSTVPAVSWEPYAYDRLKALGELRVTPSGQEYARQGATRDGRSCLLCEASLKRLQPACVLAPGFIVTSRGCHMCVSLAWHVMLNVILYDILHMTASVSNLSIGTGCGSGSLHSSGMHVSAAAVSLVIPTNKQVYRLSLAQ